MNTSHPLPPEVGLIYNLRRKFPAVSYSELLDAFHLARGIMPDGSFDNLEVIAARILERSSAIHAAAEAVPV